MRLRYSYRFLFSPGTIGPITWLARNAGAARACEARARLPLRRRSRPPDLQESRQGDAEVDRAARLVLRDSGGPFEVHEWEPWGGDERQFNSPGFDLPVGTLTRSAPGSFPEYHTSADDLDFVRPEALGASFHAYMSVFDVLETNATYVNLSPKGEPQLGRRGLYRTIGTGPTPASTSSRSSGCSISPTATTRCWTWPNGPACATRSCAAQRTRWKSTRS